MLSENSSIDVNTTSQYVIEISCTDGLDITLFDLTLLLTTEDPTVTDKPDTQSDTTPIIIGASIGGLLLIVVIIVICVRKRLHKNNENNEYEKTLHLSNTDRNSGGATPNEYSKGGEGLDEIPHDNCGYVDVNLAQMKVRHLANQPQTSEGCEYQTPWT